MFLLPDARPPRCQEIEPDIVGIPGKTAAHRFQPDSVMVDGPGRNGPQLLIGKGQPVGRFNLPADVEIQIRLKEARYRHNLDPMPFCRLLLRRIRCRVCNAGGIA